MIGERWAETRHSRRRSTSVIVRNCTAHLRLNLVSLFEAGLQLPLAVAGSGASVLEPVEDVGVTDGVEFLEKLPYSNSFVLWRIKHAAVEDGFEYEDLLGLWSPS